MNINAQKLESLVHQLSEYHLLNEREMRHALAVSSNDFSFQKQVALADSIHYHIHVASVEELPQELFINNSGAIVNSADGYIKYAFEGGINLIFSHIPVAQKEKKQRKESEAYLDHIGIDIRSDDKNTYIVFQQIPLLSAQNDYLFVRQGDGKEAVKCCHMQVKEKYWVYPEESLNYEFAFGPLIIHGTGFGVDLRPANPFIAQPAEETSACCSAPKQKASIFIH